jgi:hypothetical protein
MKRTRPLLQIALLAALLYVGYWSWQTIQARRRFAEWSESNIENERIFAALARPVKLSCGAQTLTAFARQLAAKSSLDVVIDDDALKMAYRPSADSTTVEVLCHNLPAESHLSLMLDAISLKWIIRRGQIVITTPQVAEHVPLMVASYPLPQSVLQEPSGNSNDWASVIEGVVAPDSWDDVGGRGHCAAAPGALVVVHRPAIHRQIRALFRALKSPDDPPRSLQPLVLWPEHQPANAAIFARLQRPASIDCKDLSLAELVEFLAAEHDVPILLNLKKLAEASVGTTFPITKNLSGLSLGSLLIHVAQECELTVLVRDGVIQFTTPEDAENQLTLVAYPVHDLAQPQTYRGFGPPLRDYDTLIELISSTIRPDSWDDVGGPAAVDYFGGWLLIAQTPPVHAEIESLLAQLRHNLDLGETPRVFSSLARDLAATDIEAALDRPFDASFAGLSLPELCDRFSKHLGHPVLLARHRLDEASISPETIIPFDFPPATARSQLNRILDSFDLGYTIRDEALIITTPEDAESNCLTRVYDARALHESGVTLFPTHDDRTLLDLITVHIDRDSWDDVGGPGAIDHFAGLLVISHSPEVHQAVQRFHLELLRAAKSRNGSDSIPPTPLSAAVQHIASSLDREFSFHCDQKPLREACHQFSLQLGTAIYPHEELLTESYIPDPFVPQKWLSVPRLFTFDFPSASGHVQLQRLAGHVQLESRRDPIAAVRNDIIVLTDPENIRRSLITRIYDVRALVDPQHGLFTDPNPWTGFGPIFQSTPQTELVSALTAHILDDSWNDVGGDGRIDCQQGFLIVSNSLLAHVLIEEFINGLHARQSQDHSRTISLPGQRINELITVIYDISALKALIPDLFVGMQEIPPGMSYAHHPFEGNDSLIELVRWLIHSESRTDTGGEGAISAVRDTLLVTQTLAIQREVAALLSAIEKHCSPEATKTTPPGTAVWTMPESASSGSRSDSMLHTRLVFAADLLNGPPNKDSLVSLIDSLCDEAHQKSWRQHGGPCEIASIPTGWLVISADHLTHTAIDAWLQQRRTTAPKIQAPPP